MRSIQLSRGIQAVLSAVIILLHACNPSTKDDKSSSANPLFTLLNPDSTSVHFSNSFTEGLNTNVLMYEYSYNGGGVAIGDLNGDGLQDLYFTANMTDNKLYLNNGGFKFTDITPQSGAAGRPGPWKTGVTMADVNGDGKTDIYVCYSGKMPGEKRTNQLFVNDGNDAGGIPHFSEQAGQYGLADSAYSTQGLFFDFDHDGDLDMFLLNHNPNSLPILDEARTSDILGKEAPMVGVRLFRNDNNHFIDVTKKAGISSSALTYGLGAGIADINGDGWTDMYISNDYTIPDYIYINNHNGTFTNRIRDFLGHTSHFSMGNDIADINNDALPDLFTLDMLPEDNHRQKLLFAPDNYEKFDLNLKSGFYYQYMRNMLQVNNGDGTFSEIGQISGISNTDWSWAPLFADFNNDGWKDLFVTNGYLRDYTNMDFLKYMGDFVQNSNGNIRRQNVLELVQHMPSSNMKNYLFKNNGDLTFSNSGNVWGLDSISNSNGAAYADLDNDGDLDLVVNNINRAAFVYRNESDKQLNHHFLDIKLSGEKRNSQGLGAKLFLYSNQKQQYLEQMPARGFQSSVSAVLHFGLDTEKQIDSLLVIWPEGKKQVLRNLAANQLLVLQEKDATIAPMVHDSNVPVFQETTPVLSFQNPTNTINDFKKQPLLINPLSFNGPCMVKGDVNGDKLEDVFIGGGSGLPAQLFLQQKHGGFSLSSQPDFEKDKMSEDADAVFFDANGDSLPDLYVSSGGYHNYLPSDSLLQDRLYLGNGKGDFRKAGNALPPMLVSKSCVKVLDVNKDRFPDLFVGGRNIPGRYPEIPESYLLINDGKGHFKNQAAALAPGLQHIGMVTAAITTDLNDDKLPDLVVVGEWMPISVFINRNGKLTNETAAYFDKQYSGWWNTLTVDDFNKDGKPDLVAGNLGLNTQCKASDVEPAEMFYKDFDDNGAVDPILCFYIQGKSYPYVTRDELLDQLSMMRNRFQDYKSYADATMTDIFTEDEMKDVKHLQANYLKTCLFESGKDGKFHEKPLPLQAQYAPVFTVTSIDYNEDGNKDLLLCGNINRARLRFGKYDANYGCLLEGDGKGNFNYINQKKSGFHIKGDVRSVVEINHQLLFGLNQEKPVAYTLSSKKPARK